MAGTAQAVAQHSKGTKVFVKSATVTDYVELTNLISTPAMGGQPNKIDVTNLSSGTKQTINGIKDPGDVAYKFYYVNASDSTSAYNILRKMELAGEIGSFKQVYPDGSGKTFDAEISTSIDETGVDAAITFTANLGLQGEFADLASV